MSWSRLNGLPGGGPWLILPDCPATYHNTRNAAAKTHHGGRCICPQALRLLALWISERGAVRAATKPRTRGSAPQYMSNADSFVPMPDLSSGRCTKPYGVAIMDAARDARWGGDALLQARAMCSVCPVKFTCAEWVAKAEKPAGSWSGMYAGETHMQRAARAKKAAKEKAA